jgi:hypothetical protein
MEETTHTHPQPLDKTARKARRRRRRRRILLSILVVLIAARIALPYVVLNLANKKLATLKGYYGHIKDIDISLYRGAYQIKDLFLKKLDKKDTLDFVDIALVDLAIEWKPIFHGEIVGKVLIDSSSVLLTQEKNDIQDIQKDTADFRDVLNSFMPVTLNRFEIQHSIIRYKDPYSDPKLNMLITDLHVVALNLVNAYDSAKVLPASITASANVYSGKLKATMNLDPFAKNPTFDLNTQLEKVNLVKLNPFLQAYANIDVNKGTFGLYSEVAAKGGKFEGYVKPLIKDLDIVSWNKSEGNFMQIAWESIVGAAAFILKNQRKDQLATKVYIGGDFKAPEVNIGKAVLLVLKNAFVSALKPSIDREIDLRSIGKNNNSEGFFERTFNKDKKDDPAKDKKKAEKKAEKQKKKAAKKKENS